MRQNDRRFGSYRGRRTSTDILKMIAIVLGVLVLLTLGALFLLQDRVVYEDDGIRLDLPFLREEQQRSPEVGSVSIVEQPQGNRG